MRSPSLARLFARRPRIDVEEDRCWPALPEDLRLDGEALWLRWPRLSDAEAVFAYAGDKRVSTFMDWRPHKDLDESRRFLQLLEQNRGMGREIAFGIIERESDRLVGICSLIAQRDPAVAEMGYALQYNVWGKGYMSEAVQLVSQWAFRPLHLLTIYADVHPNNRASQRVLEKAGYARMPESVPRTIKGVNSLHYRYVLQSSSL
ncbi:MAG: GNAT family N-acetyltransferase [Armatimonadetes bacterium]|nr:GNAT family N-acetyltransferase [Armatimonadota bacterium]